MDEYIKREDVERFIESGLNNPDKKNAFGYDAVCILTEVHYMPAADVEPVKHGRWIEHIDHEMLTGYDECSVCHFGTIGQSNYCPNCGAKMDLED